MRRLPWVLAVFGCLGGGTALAQSLHALAVAGPKLSMPIACTIGRDCAVQNLNDRDDGPAARDYRCGPLTYDKHNGADFRIPDLAAQRRGVAVLAAADGTVLRLRDGMADVDVRKDPAAVKDRECGNSVAIGHGDGWETQYCHMAKDSLTVRVGQTVRAGDAIGRVGLSGLTEYPHLHFTVRRGGEIIDPFAPAAAKDGTCGAGTPLWRTTPAHEGRVVLNTGFAAQAVTMEQIEAGGIAAPDAQSPILAAYGRVVGLRAGDQLKLTLFAPDGTPLAPATGPVAPNAQAQRFLLAGKRRPPAGWPKGAYRARLQVVNGAQVVAERSWTLTL